MREIVQISANIAQAATERQQSGGDLAELSLRQNAALQAVGQENRLAAVDRSELSISSLATGAFQFQFGSETSVRWQGSQSFSSGLPATFSSNFSFSFSVSSSFEVQFGEGIEVGADYLRGSDFEYDRSGLLRLLEELMELFGAQDKPEIDLGGKLDDRALELLEKLGLIDGMGQATPLLQMLSDYAGLNRFHVGQEVRAEVGYQYSAQFSARELSWQGWSQSTGASAGSATGAEESGGTSVNVSTGDGAQPGAGLQAGGDINIDDRDVININVNIESPQ